MKTQKRMTQCFFIILLVIAALPAVAEQKRQFTITVNLKSGEHKAARLKNLVRGTQLTISVKGLDTPDILILDEKNYQKYPELDRPLFQGRSFDRLTFSIEISSSGTYFLVVDNSSSPHSAKLSLVIAATAPGPAISEDNQLQISLDVLSSDLHKLFIFDPIPIDLQNCNTAGVFSDQRGIVLCNEFIEKLQTSLQDQQKTTDVLLFAIFHEFGHHLMRQWDYPFYDNEELVDEFATALLMMLRQHKRLQAASEFFIKNPTAQEILVKAFQDDRHPLSVQRARNILSWMKDPARIGRWQLFLLPHMQAVALKTLRSQAQSGKFRQALDNELAKRP